MSVEFIARILGSIVMGIGGWYLGIGLGDYAGGQRPLWGAVWAGVGALMGLIITPFITDSYSPALIIFNTMFIISITPLHHT